MNASKVEDTLNHKYKFSLPFEMFDDVFVGSSAVFPYTRS